MAKYLLIAAILVTLGTGGLAFLTKTKADALIVSRDEAQAGKQQAESQAEAARAERDKKVKELGEANKQVEEGKVALNTATAELTAAKGEVESTKTLLASTKADLDKANEALKMSSDNTKTPTVSEDPRVAVMQAEKAEIEKQLAEARQVADTLKAREQQSSEKLIAAQQEVERYKAPIRQQGISGRITAVNPGWNFVVINVGDNRGAAVNAPLIVTRGGQMVARLRITSVEPTSSIADVVPGSIARGQQVQPGDTVVFAGRGQAPTAPDNAGPAAPANGATTAAQGGAAQ